MGNPRLPNIVKGSLIIVVWWELFSSYRLCLASYRFPSFIEHAFDGVACRPVCYQINVGVPVGCLAREADDLLWLTSLYHDEKAMVDVQVSYQPLGPR